MQGYEVRTIDGDKIGHVVETNDEFLIIEHGLLKTKHALPRKLAEVDEAAGVVTTTLSKQLVYDSPKVKGGDLDHETIAEHYGLAEGYSDPPTRGLGDLEPDDPARTAEQDAERFGVDPVEDRIRIREGLSTHEGPLDEPMYSPGVTGGDRRRDYPRDEPPKDD
jgi:hypothetical protein